MDSFNRRRTSGSPPRMKHALLFVLLFLPALAFGQAGGCAGVEPIAILTTGMGDTARLCMNEQVLFDASPSYAQGGSTILEYAWDFGDGSFANTTTPTATHTYATAGTHSVALVLTASNGCTSVVPGGVLVSVSGAPSFVGTTEDVVICLGDSLHLEAMVTGTTGPSVNASLGEGMIIADMQEVGDTILVVSASPSATLQTAADLLGICVEMEHSFMGDLVIQLTCPNGTSVTLHSQGGGGTFLGQPIDDESGNHGTCWSYCWSPSANNGTWEDNSASAGTLASGTYESVGSFDALVGCPANGEWSLTLADMWGADDGYLCDWSLEFSPSIFPSVAPVYGTSADSSGWTGPDVLLPSSDPWMSTAIPTAIGPSLYTFAVTDDHGCTYSTTVSVDVTDLHLDEVSGPASYSPGETLTFFVSPALPAAEMIVWDPLSPGWFWSPSDLNHVDGVAILVAPPQLGTYTICAQPMNAACVGQQVCTTVSGTTGVVEGSGQNELAFAPNPTTGMLRMMCPVPSGPLSVEVVDASGRMITTVLLQHSTVDVDLEHCAPGMYAFRWISAAGVQRKPFVIMR